MKVKIQSKDSSSPYWALAPESLDARMIQAIKFVRDREDLCTILMSSESVFRGGLEAWQMPGNFPARLAQALMVSVDLGEKDLEEEVRTVLQGAPSTNVFGKKVSAIDSARRWLKEYGKVANLKVNL